MGEEPNTHREKTPDIEEVVEQVGKFQRKVDSLSKAVDYLTDEVMPDLFKEHKIGLVSPDDTLDAYVATLETFIHDESKWQVYGANARKYFDSFLDYNEIAENLLHFLVPVLISNPCNYRKPLICV